MASARVPGMYRWGNPSYVALPGTCRPSPSQGRGLQVPFFFSGGGAGRADPMRRACEVHGNPPCAMGHRAPCPRGEGEREGQEGL